MAAFVFNIYPEPKQRKWEQTPREAFPTDKLLFTTF